ncbi:MAG: hypothetical protein COA68_04965 [Oceanobacter sp.]|jgi:hypothetical protein|nr:MAG: hypothetical protein COA68_04965 [Oceanobacter sp.]
MRNFIKYSKLKLRDSPESCSPVGPDFTSASNHTVTLAGTQLGFKAPRHDPPPYGKIRQRRISNSYSLSDARVHGYNFQPSQSWKTTEVFFRDWSFCGPWFTGFMGDTSCCLQVIQLSEPDAEINFLHPQALEIASLAYITANYGYRVYDEDNGDMHYIAPVNWSTVSQLEVPSVQFDSERLMRGAAPERHVFIPISRSHIAYFSLRTLQSASGTRDEVDRQVDPTPFKELVDNIVGSIRVTLSPEAQADWDEIRKSNPDAKVSETCAPLKWPADVDKDGLTILEYDPKRYA